MKSPVDPSVISVVAMTAGISRFELNPFFPFPLLLSCNKNQCRHDAHAPSQKNRSDDTLRRVPNAPSVCA